MRATRKLGWLKLLDRYAGIPAVAALAPLRILRRGPGAIRRIGVMKTAAIGDLVLASGPIAGLRAAYPDADLALITGADNAGVVPLLPFKVDRHVTVSPTRPADAVRRIRALDLDLIIDLGSWPRFDAMLAALSGARWRVGFRRANQGRHWAFDQTVEHSGSLHEVTNYRALVGAVVANALDLPPRLCAADLPAGFRPSRPYLVFHPWSGGDRGAIKEWPRERWTELAARLGSGYAYVVTGGPGDHERSQAIVADLANAGLDATVLGRPLGETAAVLANAAAVVAVNTGIMHVAAAVGAPTLSLEGPVPIKRWGPIGDRVMSVETSFDDRGYLDLGFEYDGHRADCMDGLSVDAVEAALRELIGAHKSTRK